MDSVWTPLDDQKQILIFRQKKSDPSRSVFRARSDPILASLQSSIRRSHLEHGSRRFFPSAPDAKSGVVGRGSYLVEPILTTVMEVPSKKTAPGQPRPLLRESNSHSPESQSMPPPLRRYFELRHSNGPRIELEPKPGTALTLATTSPEARFDPRPRRLTSRLHMLHVEHRLVPGRSKHQLSRTKKESK